MVLRGPGLVSRLLVVFDDFDFLGANGHVGGSATVLVERAGLLEGHVDQVLVLRTDRVQRQPLLVDVHGFGVLTVEVLHLHLLGGVA